VSGGRASAFMSRSKFLACFGVAQAIHVMGGSSASLASESFACPTRCPVTWLEIVVTRPDAPPLRDSHHATRDAADAVVARLLSTGKN
jgi:hypothetical protein